MFRDSLEEGWSRPGARRSQADFEILPTVMVVVDDDVERAADFAQADDRVVRRRHGRDAR